MSTSGRAPDPREGARKRLVLVGGGHAHLFVLKAFAEAPEPGLDLTLVAKDRQTPYSGMLPGYVAGLYERDEMHVDLGVLARRCGARLVVDEAVGLDAGRRLVRLKGGGTLPYDVVSVDIGITPDLDALPGARHAALAVKPIGDFLAKWERVRAEALAPDGPRRFAIVGGGVAGICLAFAIAAALRRGAPAAGLDPAEFAVTLISAAPPSDVNPLMRRAVHRALRRHGIAIRAGDAAASIDPAGVTLASGARVASDAVLVSTQARPPALISESGLRRDEGGFLAIRPTLQALDHDEIFAAGDSATQVAEPRPKAGVFAVRQGPPLAGNLRRYLRGETLREHRPQKNWLVLIGTGDGRAIGGRGRYLAVEGRWVWRLKDWIDRRFMRRFR
jgi:pyridine nucleotide-disulfide oxidoreductase family protein